MPFVFNDDVKPVAEVDSSAFDAVVAAIAGTEQVKSFVAEGTVDEVEAQVKEARKLLPISGIKAEPPVTVRIREEVLDDGISVKVYFWTTKKITYKPRAKRSTTPEPKPAAKK